jgi:sister-chromatid-cohesion protein PDS5
MKHTTGKGKMKNQLEQQVFEVGIKLQSLPHFKYTLLTILKPTTKILSKIDQSPSQVMLDAIHPLREALVMPMLLRHQDGGVSLMVATCISEIIRISTPDVPYEDDVMRDAFQLIISTF